MDFSNPFFVVPTILILVLAGLLIFALFWLFVVWLISIVSGWRKLAGRYPALNPPTGLSFHSQTLLLNRSRYRHTMDMTTNAVGIWMQPMWLFRLGHAPVFIPWSEFSSPQITAWRGEQLVQLDLGSPPLATVAMPAAVLESDPAASPLLPVR